MDVLPDEQELSIQQAVGEFLAAESTPALVRASEKTPAGHSAELWRKFASLGWLGLCLPEEHGGQALPLTFLVLLFEELGRHIAPLPAHATLVPALVIARHGSAAQQALLGPVAAGRTQLCFALQEASGRWDLDGVRLAARRDGDSLVLSGTKCFVDNFGNAAQCLAAVRLDGQPALVLVDTRAPGLRSEKLVTLANDDQHTVAFDGVRVPAASLLGGGTRAIEELMDLAALLMAAQMQGAARRAMEMATAHVSGREAFGQPIGSFQAIQHMAADMLNAVDGTQLLTREAAWLWSEGCPRGVEVAQAKSFANEKCQATVRGTQQMFGGMGFIAVTDINLWYRRVAAWALRCGTTYEHRGLIAASLLDVPGKVRLGMRQALPAGAPAALAVTATTGPATIGA